MAGRGVPADGELALGEVSLPAGTQIRDSSGRPLLWATSKPVDDVGQVWLALSALQPQTGLAPITLAFLEPGARRGRPWDSGELEGGSDGSDADRLNPSRVLAENWADSIDPDDREDRAVIAPFSPQFPGMATGEYQELSAGDVAAALAALPPARIGLVPTREPADVLSLIGFAGAANRYETPAPVTAVLRSWEARFGAVLVEVGFDHIRLLVRRPPRTRAAATAVAAEHFAMCDEFWNAEGEGLTTVSEIAEYLPGAPMWALWWD